MSGSTLDNNSQAALSINTGTAINNGVAPTPAGDPFSLLSFTFRTLLTAVTGAPTQALLICELVGVALDKVVDSQLFQFSTDLQPVVQVVGSMREQAMLAQESVGDPLTNFHADRVVALCGDLHGRLGGYQQSAILNDFSVGQRKSLASDGPFILRIAENSLALQGSDADLQSPIRIGAAIQRITAVAA